MEAKYKTVKIADLIFLLACLLARRNSFRRYRAFRRSSTCVDELLLVNGARRRRPTNSRRLISEALQCVAQQFAILCCVSVLCTSVSAQTANPANTSSAFALPNGLRVLSRERHLSPLVAIDLWVRAGAREEREGEDGCAHFLEHTLFKGTSNRAAGQADMDIENLGASLTAATGPDYAHFYTTVAATHVSEALHILADVARNATLPAMEVERERGVILDELAAHDSDPTAHLIDLLYVRAFPTQPYGRSPGGSGAAIRLRGRDTLAAFYARAYRPERCTLVLAGDISSAQARQIAREAFGDWQPLPIAPLLPSGPLEPSTPRSSAEQQRQLPQTLEAAQDKEQTFAVPRLPLVSVEETSAFPDDLIGLAFPGPPARDHTMTLAARMVAEMIGDSREYGRVRAAEFVSAHATARYTPRLDGSLWMLTLQETNPRPTTNRLAQLRALVADLRAHPPTQRELQAARSHILGRMQADMETNAGLAYAIGYADVVGDLEPEALRARLQAITAGDVQRFVSSYLLSQPSVTVHLAPAAPVPERRP